MFFKIVLTKVSLQAAHHTEGGREQQIKRLEPQLHFKIRFFFWYIFLALWELETQNIASPHFRFPVLTPSHLLPKQTDIHKINRH